MIEDLEQLKNSASENRKKKRDREIADFKKVLSMVEGRRFIWRLMAEAGVFRSSFNLSDLAMSNNEGRRDMGLLLLNEMLAVSPNSFIQAQREAVSDYKSEHAQNLEGALDEKD